VPDSENFSVLPFYGDGVKIWQIMPARPGLIRNLDCGQFPVYQEQQAPNFLAFAGNWEQGVNGFDIEI
jgi:hypothetical protein